MDGLFTIRTQQLASMLTPDCVDIVGIKVDRPLPDASIEQVRAFALIVAVALGMFPDEARRLAVDYNLRYRKEASA